MIHQRIATDLLVEPLQPDQVYTVYPLLRFADPSLRLADWLRYARRLTRRRRPAQDGVLVVRRAARPHPCGAAWYRRHTVLTDDGVLTAEHIVSVELFQTELVFSALIAGLEMAAARLQCKTIRIFVPEQRTGLADVLPASGHTPLGLTFTKALVSAS